MSLENTLFLLRIVSALALLGIFGVMLLIVYRDMRVTAEFLDAQQKSHGTLLVVTTESADLAPGDEFPLLPVTGIGRHPSNIIVLQDEYASGEHALLALRHGRWWLEDLGSRNGTLLNGQRLQNIAVISPGDMITIGSTTLKLTLL